jgi:hypothetical protein
MPDCPVILFDDALDKIMTGFDDVRAHGKEYQKKKREEIQLQSLINCYENTGYRYH